jgi:serine/threonine-protein kinase
MEGVVAAHAAGVVHRDLKPENIFLARDSAEGEVVPKVIDFGISKTSGADLARLTQSGMAMGTPRYISFEQLRGDATVDARSDIYAIGVVLYEALVGRPPYQANSLGEQAIQFLTHDPPAPKQLRPELPDVLSALTFKAIARDREQRFESMEAFIKDLRSFAQPSAYPSPMLAWAGSPLSTPGAFGNELSTLPVAPSAELPAATSPVASLPPPAVLRRPVRRLVGLLLATIVLSVVWAYWPHALRTGGTESAPLVTAKVSIDGAPGVSSRADTPSVSGASLAPAKAVASDELATGADRDAAEAPREVQSLAREAAQRVPRSATSAAPSARGGLNKRANKPSVAVQTLLAASLSEATTVLDPVAQDAGVQEDSRHRAGRVARDQF